MWPLPVVSSTKTISPAPMWRVSPSLAVIETPPARLITYCRRGARCQLFSASPHAMPCHQNIEEYLTAYLDGAGLRDDPKGPLFRTIGRGTGALTRTLLPQANAYAMIRRRAAAAGIATKLGNHSFRATGITAYLKNGGTLEKAAAMANHAATRTTQAYDRRGDEVSLEEVERIVI
jgi:integrase/recombinase XerC